MRHLGLIAGVQLESDCDFVVFGHSRGLVAECGDLAEAKRGLLNKLAESKQHNMDCDLAIFRWSRGKWLPAIGPYEMQEWEIQSNPSRLFRFP